MKKLVSAMSLLLGLGLATAQQTHPATTTQTAPPKVVKVETHKTMPTQAQNDKKIKTVSPKSAVAITSTKKTKTPKITAKPGVKLKKDGTPDKRYKENQHLKKDGTPDKRYKENK